MECPTIEVASFFTFFFVSERQCSFTNNRPKIALSSQGFHLKTRAIGLSTRLYIYFIFPFKISRWVGNKYPEKFGSSVELGWTSTVARVISSKSHATLTGCRRNCHARFAILFVFCLYAMALVVALSSWFPPTTVFEHGMEPVKRAAGEQHSGYVQ